MLQYHCRGFLWDMVDSTIQITIGIFEKVSCIIVLVDMVLVIHC